MATTAEVRLLRDALTDVERRAKQLPWSGPREDTWRVATYVREEDGLPLVDLHDLDRDLALVVCDTLVAHRDALGTVRLVTGRGRHSEGGRAVLRDLVRARLEAEGWQVSATGAGHLDVRATGAAVARPGFWTILFRLLAWLFGRR